MTSESTSAIYDRSANDWQREEPVLLSDFTARPFLLDWCGDVNGADVADLGCGEGYVARQLSGRGARSVYGVDVSAEMVAAAQASAPDGCVFRHGDATNLEAIDDSSKDLAVAVFLLNYCTREQTLDVMREVVRILKPGGRFVFSVPHPSLPWLRGEEPPFYFRREGVARGYFTGRNQTFEGRIWRRDGVAVDVRCVHKTLEDYFSCLSAAGFDALPDVQELRVSDAHIEFDPAFFSPLRDQPLHLAFRISTPGGTR